MAATRQIGAGKDDDKFAKFVQKWQQQSREQLAEANKEKMDYLNNIDQFESISQMREEAQQLAQKEWNELTYRKKLAQIVSQFLIRVKIPFDYPHLE